MLAMLHFKCMELQDIIKEPIVVHEGTTLQEALENMVHKQTNTLLVIDATGVLSGEVSVSDILDAVVPEYLDGDNVAAHFATEEMFKEAVNDAREKTVVEFMSADIDPIHIDDGIMSVAAKAIAQRKARIPVVDDENRPVGIISRRGIKHILAEHLQISDSA